MSRSFLAGIVLAATVLAGACGGGSSKPSAASSAEPDLAKFCTAMTTLSKGYTGQSAEDIDTVLRDAEANAPTELRDDLVRFATSAKAVTAAALAAGGTSSSFDASVFVASLSPNEQQFVQDLAAATKGSMPDGYVGRVLEFSASHCGDATSSSFSSVGTPVN